MELGYVYKLHWEQTPVCYIGATYEINQRLRGHFSSLKRGKHNQKKIQDAYDLYGKPLIEILYQGDYHNEIPEKEAYYQSITPNCVNKPARWYTDKNYKSPIVKPIDLKVDIKISKHYLDKFQRKYGPIQDFICQKLKEKLNTSYLHIGEYYDKHN